MKPRFPLIQIMMLIAASVAFLVVAQVIHVRVKGNTGADVFDTLIWGVAMCLGVLLPIRKYTVWRDGVQAAERERSHDT